MLHFFILLFSTTLFAKNFVPSSFTTSFQESLVSSATGKEKKSYGKIDYKFPGSIRFEVTAPEPDITVIVSNPQQIWYYKPPFVKGEQGQVTIQKAANLPLTKFLDSLKNGLEGSKTFTAKYEGTTLTLVFTPAAQKEYTLKEVILTGTKDAKTIQSLSDFQKLTLHYNDGRKTNLTFSEFKENVPLSGDHFVFKVPENTKVTR